MKIFLDKIIFIKILSIYLSVYFKKNEKYLESIIKSFLNLKAISIIIPIFNKEFYLVECLNSVLHQTLKNIEVLCIDDGSTDNSSNVVKRYIGLDNRFVLLKQNNKGAGFSRNKGINISKGKYIFFLDSDDYLFNENTLEILYNKANKNNAIICGGGIRLFTEKNNTITFNDDLFEYEGFMEYNDYQYDFYYQRFIYNSKFLRKKKIYFPPYLRYQDPPFFIKAMSLAKKFYVIKNITYKYRRNYREINAKQATQVFYGFKDCLKFAKEMKLYQLYNLTLNRLNSKYLIDRIKKYENETELKKIIMEITKIIDINIINKQKINFTIDNFYKNFNNEKLY